MVGMINSQTPSGAIVYTALPLPDAYCARIVLLDYTSATSNNIRDGLKTGPETARKALRDAGVGYVLIHRLEAHANSIAANPGLWGCERKAESGPVTLYKVT
jgi:hypothetical protein